MNRKNQTLQLTEELRDANINTLSQRWLRYAFKKDALKKSHGFESNKKNPIYVKDEQGTQTTFRCPECEKIVDENDAVVIGPGKIACSICAAKNHKKFPESFKEWLSLSEKSYSEKKKPRHAKMVDNFKEKFNKGSIDMTSHLKDYATHIEKFGDGLGPFKILGSHKKSSAPAAN